MKRLARGQASLEYAATSTLLLLALVGVGAVTPVGELFLRALQDYVDLMMYSLSLALG